MAQPGYQPTVGDRPVGQTKRRVGTTSASFGAGVGAAMQDLGRGFKDAANVFSAIEEQNKQSRTREREVEFQNSTREVTHGPDGYFARTGTQALGDNRTSYAETLKREQQRIAESIDDPGERQAFLDRTSQRIADRLDTAALHETEQSRAAAVGSREAMRLAAEEEALSFFDNDDMFEKHLEEALAHADDLAEFTGTPEEVAANARTEIASNLIRNRAILIADRDPEAAMELIESDDRLTEQHRKELRDNLQPLVRQHRADQLVTRYTHTVQNPNQSFKDRLAYKESGGDPSAQAAGSSAAGLFQFTKGTWDNFMGRLEASGRIPEGYDLSTMSASERQNLRLDGNFVNAVADDWIAELDGTLRSIGKPVNDGNRYVVHHMGAGGATWLLNARAGQTARELYRANGKSWDAVVAANPKMFTANMTAMQAVQAVKTYFGAGNGLAPSGDGVTGFDAAGALEEANRIEDPDDRAAAIAAIETRNAQINAQNTARSGAALTDATERYLETGSTELTLQEKLTLGAAGMESFTAYVNRDRTNSLADNPVAVDQLLQMAASSNRGTLNEFAAEGYLEQFRHEMSRPQYDTLLAQRRAVRAELEGRRMTEEQLRQNPEMAVKVTNDMQAYGEKSMTALGLMKGSDEEKANYRMLLERRLYQDLLEFQNKHQRQPTEGEWRPMIDAAMAETTQQSGGFLGFGKVNVPAFVAEVTAADGDIVELTTDYEAVPANERERIAELLLATTGQVPTKEEVARAYADTVQMRGGQPPMGMTPEEMPQDALRFLTSPPPGSNIAPMAPEEAATAYQRYTMGVMMGSIDPYTQPFLPESAGVKPSVPEIDTPPATPSARPSPRVPPSERTPDTPENTNRRSEKDRLSRRVPPSQRTQETQ